MPYHRYRATAFLVVAAIAGGCTSGRNAKVSAAGTTSSSSAASSVTSTTATSTTAEAATTAAVLAGYRAQDAAFYEAADQYPVNPTAPLLAATMTGAELVTVRSHLTAARFQSQYVVGRADLSPMVTGIEGTTATLSDCLFDHSRVVDGRTGKTVGGPDTERRLKRVTLQLVDGVWKVATVQEVSVGCQPGDV